MFQLSTIDEERFGMRTVKTSAIVDARTLSACTDFCGANDVELLISRVEGTQIELVQRLEAEGFLLMDTLICYEEDLAAHQARFDAALEAGDLRMTIRALAPGDHDSVIRIAREAFSDYHGHYHADPRLDREHCDAVYESWAENSLTNAAFADWILVAEDGNGVVGFLTLQAISPDTVQLVLSGVAGATQMRGVYRTLIASGANLAMSEGYSRLFASTQITNLPVQRVWVRLGFEPSGSIYTFHRWFGRN